jgi:thiamine kinase-like enzyme
LTRAPAALACLLGEPWRAAHIEPIGTSTNFVARATLGAERVALRIPRAHTASVPIDRGVEQSALATAAGAGLAPPLLASDAHAGILITRWIDGDVWSWDRAREPGAQELIGRLLRRLHALALPADVPVLDLDSLVSHYLAALAEKRDPWLGECAALQPRALQLLDRMRSPRNALCHCDVHHANLLESDGTLFLLDWEYAGGCDPYFDLAAYAVYHELDDPALERLLKAHGMRDLPDALTTLHRWRWVVEYVCLLWLRATAVRDGTRRGNAQVVERLDAGRLVARLRSQPL